MNKFQIQESKILDSRIQNSESWIQIRIQIQILYESTWRNVEAVVVVVVFVFVFGGLAVVVLAIVVNDGSWNIERDSQTTERG